MLFMLLKEVAAAHLFEGAATISYYLLFSLFPFLMFLSSLLSSLPVTFIIRESFLSYLIPERSVSLIEGYMNDMSLHPTWLVFGLFLTIISLRKAVEVIKRRVRLAFRSEYKGNIISEFGVSLLFVILILFSLIASLLLIVTGEKVIAYVLSAFPHFQAFSVLLEHFRLIIFGIFVLFVIMGINYVLPATALRLRETIPGSLFSGFAMLISSRLFSIYVDRLNGFSNLYGSLGSVIVLLSWLFLFSFLLLIGSHINAFLYRYRREVRF